MYNYQHTKSSRVSLDLENLKSILSENGYEFIEYINSRKILVSDKYGTYYASAGSLRNGLLPTIKAAVDKTTVFINRANEIHGNIYDYSKTYVINVNKKVIIGCYKHGYFEQIATSHLCGVRCLKCFNEGSGFTKAKFINHCNESGVLYIIRCFNDIEEFYKIGITSKTIKERFHGIYKMPYNYEIIQEIKDIPNTIYDLEKFLHKLYKCYNYKPTHHFGGFNECYKI